MDKIRHPVAVWNDVSCSMLRAMMYEENGSLPVIAAIEPANPVDPQAVIILLDVGRIIAAFAGTQANLAESQGVSASGYVRLGYLLRAEGKPEISAWLCQQPGMSIAGYMVADGEMGGYRFEWSAPASDDDDIPF